MRLFRLPMLLLSAVLQFAPLVRVATADASAVLAPVLAVLRWLAGATAVAGSFHAVSGATGVRLTQSTTVVTSPKGTNGVAFGLRVQITVTVPANANAASYSAFGLPSGLVISANQGVISGVPTVSGVFDAEITRWSSRPPGSQRDIDSNHFFTAIVPIEIVDTAPVITVQPVGRSVAVGQSVTLGVTATGSSLSYQWIKDDIELDATEATYTIAAASLADAGSYRVRVSNSGGLVVSESVKLTVNDLGTPPTLAEPFTGRDAYAGDAVALEVRATGSGPLTYAWGKGAVALTATGSALLFPAFTAADAGDYAVKITGANGSLTVGPVALKLLPPPQLAVAPFDPAAGATFTVDSQVGRSYVLESRGAFDESPWTAEQTQTAAGGALDFIVVPSTAAGRFWRVRVVPLTP